ncbi:hypothetical protein ANN_18559 [Periplaneta americana]|uniref:Uncharacterized protein n=1 Tax=Periplaneta americana TaxID=6978 RepID=A0ABQ8SQK1_PERAM|nr:hypothetical protein ANN_18559 [Periplaneta americana]
MLNQTKITSIGHLDPLFDFLRNIIVHLDYGPQEEEEEEEEEEEGGGGDDVIGPWREERVANVAAHSIVWLEVGVLYDKYACISNNYTFRNVSPCQVHYIYEIFPRRPNAISRMMSKTRNARELRDETRKTDASNTASESGS